MFNMATPNPTEKTKSLDQAVSHTFSSKLTVIERYHELLAEQVSQPDKVFIDGYELREHDPNLVVLNHDDQEHPRVYFLYVVQGRKQANDKPELGHCKESPCNRHCGRLLFPLAFFEHHLCAFNSPPHA